MADAPRITVEDTNASLGNWAFVIRVIVKPDACAESTI
jgi:hypothetical protein